MKICIKSAKWTSDGLLHFKVSLLQCNYTKFWKVIINLMWLIELRFDLGACDYALFIDTTCNV